MSESPLAAPPPAAPGQRMRWYGLAGCASSLAIADAARSSGTLDCVIVADAGSAWRIERELRFFLGSNGPEVFSFPDWETLAYDSFSPHQEIVSERLATLARLPNTRSGILVVPVTTVLHRVVPTDYVASRALRIAVGDRFDLAARREHLVAAGYRVVDTVHEHGELAVRGAIVDLFPMGSPLPYRIDLFDDEIESLRTFDPETQRTIEKIPAIDILPGRETPLDADSIARFRDAWHRRFDVDERRCPVYQDVRSGLASPGIEYWLPLFFERLATLFDYLPANTRLFSVGGIEAEATRFRTDVLARYESLRHDIERPLVHPDEMYLRIDELFAALNDFPRTELLPGEPHGRAAHYAFVTEPVTNIAVNPHAEVRTGNLQAFLRDSAARVLFCAESAGRQEVLDGLLRRDGIEVQTVDGWSGFLGSLGGHGITIAPLEASFHCPHANLAVISEADLLGQRSGRPQRVRSRQIDPDQVIKNLTELSIGSPVVHIDHGVGRYLGLTTLEIDGAASEFLTLEYAEGARLYVPVASLHLVTRYTGADAETAPLHRLGSDAWEKAKRKAAEQARDVAAELLSIHARREARAGFAYDVDEREFERFCEQFPFEETPDQIDAIERVLADMRAPAPMDRLVCGDVGFGKTEVAMRAAFVAVHGGRQVALLVPTTLLAQQHFDSFRDRFADWPVRIELISRMRTDAEVAAVAERLARGQVDIVIGTHRLLSRGIDFAELGLVIIDEEHRFGVRHKERLKDLRAEVDILTLTATPIPRTLNMAMSGIRDISVIATPPARRLSIKTFVRQHSKALVKDAIDREIRRGGQVFYLHNEVRSIARVADELAEWVPDARIAVAHGQMRKRELEGVMSDFYHRRSNVLVCTTIIETGIDIPNANTIIIDRADHFGLAQLHQLRGRVGRSHRQAYCYLLCPHPKAMTADAVRRLEAIEAAGELGVGFTLATHDLEIRGAGELLGEGQSGHIQSIGFSLYMEMLDRAVAAIRSGTTPNLDEPLEHGVEVNLHVPALIPEDYLPDVHMRLILYKRIASAGGDEELDQLLAEMIDRFGQVGDPVRNLLRITRIKLTAHSLGISKLDIGPSGGRVVFEPTTRVDPIELVRLVQSQPGTYRLDGGNTLRLLSGHAQAQARFEAVEKLLARLAPEPLPEAASA